MHPFVKLCFFIAVLVLLSDSNFLGLLAMLLAMLVMMWVTKTKGFLNVLNRMRWLLISMLLIFAFATPGELLPFFPVQFAPTHEGVHAGMLHLLKFITALSALHLLVTSASRQNLALALYMLLWPLKYLRINIEKFTARLLLTLHYVEDIAEHGKPVINFANLDNIQLRHQKLKYETVMLPHRSFKLTDVAALLLLALGLTGFYWGN